MRMEGQEPGEEATRIAAATSECAFCGDCL